MKLRGLNKRFLDAMRVKLVEGEHHDIGWEEHWPDPLRLRGRSGELMNRLREEVEELDLAVWQGDAEAILCEAADVANFAMFIADIYETDRS